MTDEETCYVKLKISNLPNLTQIKEVPLSKINHQKGENYQGKNYLKKLFLQDEGPQLLFEKSK